MCTGSPVSMDGVVMDSVTSASYSALLASDICTGLTINHVFYTLHLCIFCVSYHYCALQDFIITFATAKLGSGKLICSFSALKFGAMMEALILIHNYLIYMYWREFTGYWVVLKNVSWNVVP